MLRGCQSMFARTHSSFPPERRTQCQGVAVADLMSNVLEGVGLSLRRSAARARRHVASTQLHSGPTPPGVTI